MSAQDLEQRALEFLAAEYERDGKTGSAEHIRTQPLLPNKARAVRAIVAALRQQPAPVDLEQFREIAEGLRLADQFFDGDDSHWQWDDGEFFPASKVRAAHKRLLALIDNAGKSCPCGEATCTESWEPGCGLGESVEHAVPAEREPPRGDELRAILAHQPAPVVDDARMARALEWARDVAQGMPASAAKEHLPAIQEAIAAYDPKCGARTVRVVDDAMVEWKPRNRTEAVALAKIALAHLGVVDAYIDNAIARMETDAARAQGEPK